MSFVDFITDPATLAAAKSTAWSCVASILLSAAAMALTLCWRRL